MNPKTKFYNAITQTPEEDSQDSFMLVGTSLFNAYRNAISIMGSVKEKTNGTRHIVKVIPAPHLDEHWNSMK